MFQQFEPGTAAHPTSTPLRSPDGLAFSFRRQTTPTACSRRLRRRDGATREGRTTRSMASIDRLVDEARFGSRPPHVGDQHSRAVMMEEVDGRVDVNDHPQRCSEDGITVSPPAPKKAIGTRRHASRTDRGPTTRLSGTLLLARGWLA